ncbi:MAG TPA: glycosyl transferase family 2 [Bacteroidales bacterium]|nr:glycosyl transferase family 2 [Bacteroidales bacterium]
MSVQVSVITINYNGKKFFEPFMESLENIDKDGITMEIIVVDNLSTDDSVNFIRTKYPTVAVIENNINNYTNAVNLGIKESKGQYIALLNNDTTVAKNWLKDLISIIAKNERIGAVQSKILFSDKETINSVGVEEVEDFYFKDIGFGEKDIGQYGAKEIDYMTGGSVLFRRECLDEVGEFDEDFIMYMEDIDYSIRCRDLGWKIFYSPESVIYHRYHGTASSSLCEYFCSRNRLLLLGKRFPTKFAKSIKTSHFYMKNELDDLYHSLIQATKKLADNNDNETVRQTLQELASILLEIFGPHKTLRFFYQMEVVLGLRKIKVGIYDHAFHFAGGGQRYVAELAQILQDRYEITYIANKDIRLEKYKEWFGIDLSKCKLKVIKIPFFERMGRPLIDEGMVANEAENPFDIIMEESINYDIFINANMLSKVKPLSSLSIFICHFPDSNRERFFNADKYDYIITNSNYTTFWLKQKWGLNATLRLYPPVDMFNDGINMAKKDKTILSVSRFEMGGSKKQLEMIGAFCELCKRDQYIRDNWRLVLAGGTSKGNCYYDKVRQMANYSKNIKIELMPNLNNSELKNLYSQASIFWHACGLGEINPHLIEHFGMTTVEAMQNYCVPVVIDGGGQREIVEHGISGFRFTAKEELISFTLKLIRDVDTREIMAKNAYERSQDFTKEEFKNKALEFFSDIENRIKGGEAIEVRTTSLNSHSSILPGSNKQGHKAEIRCFL